MGDALCGYSVCCDTCPYTPTCEEIADFERDVLRLGGEWGEEHGDD